MVATSPHIKKRPSEPLKIAICGDSKNSFCLPTPDIYALQLDISNSPKCMLYAYVCPSKPKQNYTLLHNYCLKYSSMIPRAVLYMAPEIDMPL